MNGATSVVGPSSDLFLGGFLINVELTIVLWLHQAFKVATDCGLIWYEGSGRVSFTTGMAPGCGVAISIRLNSVCQSDAESTRPCNTMCL